MPTWTIVFFDVAGFLGTAGGSMIVLGCLRLLTSDRIDILTAELFATGPTPGSTTPGSNHKVTSGLETACKNIVAGGVFESPSFTPGTLFGVVGHGLCWGDRFRFRDLDIKYRDHWGLLYRNR
jgi:hypothetical protein